MSNEIKNNSNFNFNHNYFPVKNNSNLNKEKHLSQFNSQKKNEIFNIFCPSNTYLTNIFDLSEQNDNIAYSGIDNCFSSNSKDDLENSSNACMTLVNNDEISIQNKEKTNNSKSTFNKISTKLDNSKRFWSKKEDSLLLNYILNNKSKNWKKISEHIKTKTSQQCSYRYGKLISDMNKKKWSRKEDIKLIELHESYGSDWFSISQFFNNKNQRDVEFRYKEKLDPNVKMTEFTKKEDNLIIKLYKVHGNKWFEISRHFKTRNSQMIKKRYNLYLKQIIKPNLNPMEKLGLKASKNENENSSIIYKSYDAENINMNPLEIEADNYSDRIVDKNQFNCDNYITVNEHLRNKDIQRCTLINKENSYGCKNIKNDEDTNFLFNIDSYFEPSFNQNKNDKYDFFDTNKEVEVPFDNTRNNRVQLNENIPIQIQFGKLDDYFRKLHHAYDAKINEFNSLLEYCNKMKIKYSNILGISSQLDHKVAILVNEVNFLVQERVKNKMFSVNILKYIEIIMVFIEQIKKKIYAIEEIRNLVKEKIDTEGNL